MTTQTTGTETGTAIRAFEEKIVAQIKDAEARIAAFEVRAREKRLQAELGAITVLQAGRQNLEQKLAALRTQQGPNITRAKAEIDAAAVTLKQSLDDLGRKLSIPAAQE